MFKAPLFQQVPEATLTELRKMRDAQLAVRAWRYKQAKLRDKKNRKHVGNYI